jgi:hypothetical protein
MMFLMEWECRGTLCKDKRRHLRQTCSNEEKGKSRKRKRI